MAEQSRKQDYGTGYLYAEDLLSNGRFHTATVEVSEVHPPGTLKAADGKLVDKWALSFAGKEKKLCLCKTNASIIHLITGDPPGDTWKGKSITLQAREVDAFGTKTLAIRVIPPKGTVMRKKLYERMGKPAEHKGTDNG